jgi:hypothetical protein
VSVETVKEKIYLERPLGDASRGAGRFTVEASKFARGGLSIFDGQRNPAGSAALGVTSCFSVVTGAIAIYEAIEEFQAAVKADDAYRQAQALLKGMRGVAQSLAGAVFIPARGLAILAVSSASKALSAVSKLLVRVGAALNGAGYLVTGVSSLFSIAHLLSAPKTDLEKLALAVAGVVFAILGVVSAGLTVASFGGPTLIAIAVLDLIAGLGCMLIDGYQFVNSLQSGNIGRYDEVWLLLTTAVCLGAVILALAFSETALAAVVACVLGSVWLAINLICFYYLYQARKC